MAGAVARETPARARAVAAQARRAFRERRSPRDEGAWLVALVSLTFVILVLAVSGYAWFPLSVFVVPLVAGSLLLERRGFVALTLVVTGSVLATLGVIGSTPSRVAWAVVMAVIAVILLVASHRSLLGADGRLGESMLIDLRDRLQTQSELPPLPHEWYAQAVMRSAGGAQFAGDFIVATTTDAGGLLEVVVVDVSGKGIAAGTRALQLSGRSAACSAPSRPSSSFPPPMATCSARTGARGSPPRRTWPYGSTREFSHSVRPGTPLGSNGTPGPGDGRCSSRTAPPSASSTAPISPR